MRIYSFRERHEIIIISSYYYYNNNAAHDWLEGSAQQALKKHDFRKLPLPSYSMREIFWDADMIIIATRHFFLLPERVQSTRNHLSLVFSTCHWEYADFGELPPTTECLRIGREVIFRHWWSPAYFRLPNYIWLFSRPSQLMYAYWASYLIYDLLKMRFRAWASLATFKRKMILFDARSHPTVAIKTRRAFSSASF